MPGLSLKQQFPLRLIIGSEDCTQLLSDGATFSNADPGGFEAASFTIPKDMPQTLRGQYVRLDSGLHVAWEGRISEVQRSLGNSTAIQCEGYQALFKDEQQSMIFVDRDITRWQDPSYSRQLAIYNANEQLASSQVASDPVSNTPSLVQQITDSWTTPWVPLNESWYDAGPENLVAFVFYDLVCQEGLTAGNWLERILLSADANLGAIVDSGNLHSGSEVHGYFNFSGGTQYRYAVLEHVYGATNSGAQGATYNAYWKNVAVFGNHGLTGYGVAPSGDPVGYYPSDIFGWCVDQLPGVQLGVTQLTDAANYIMPHSVYYTPVGLDQIGGDMATAAGWHWGVWESLSPLTGNPQPRADFRPYLPQGSFTAFCRRQDCDTLDIREDLSGQYDEAVVNFTDAAGVSQCAIVQIDNPILDAAGIPGRTVAFDGGTMTPATAALFGAEALAITNAQTRVAGTADIIAAIDGPSGPMPAWLLKAGIDRLRVGDLPSVDAFGAYNDVPISRVECSIGTSGWTTSVEVGQGADLVETIQARLTAAATLAQQG